MTSEDENNLILVAIMVGIGFMIYSVLNKSAAAPVSSGSGSVGPITSTNAAGQTITTDPNTGDLVDWGVSGGGW